MQGLHADAKVLLDHLNKGGGWGIGPFRPAVVKKVAYIRKMRIGGRVCETANAVGDLVDRLEAEIDFMRISKRWASHHPIVAETFAERIAELEDLCEPLEEAFDALAIANSLTGVIRGESPGIEPDWADPAALLRLRKALAALESTRRYDIARERFDQVVEELRVQASRGQLDPVSVELTSSVVERDSLKYETAWQKAASNSELDTLLDCRRELLGRLMAEAPALGRILLETYTDQSWDDRAPSFESAWNWSRTRSWITALAAPHAEEQYRLELENVKDEIAGTLELLAAERAWGYCCSRMTSVERQNLIAWSQAVRNIGKGTGKHASRHRRAAREYLNKSRSAIPAWVMPLHRVAETIRPGSEVFDVAIIDEASQSGPEALLLAYLAKKLVVVGDDKQIHPTYAGVDYTAVNQLRERHISHLPHAYAYGADHSFFDLAAIRYDGLIRLREHFRCMPEIIQFSNNLSYRGNPLIPLRQYGVGRLEPPVAAVHVSGGYQVGKGSRSVNSPEIEAIVNKVQQIHCDPAYEGKTIGIISLIGDAQAREIEKRLVREFGPDKMEARQIVCGNAYAFQGDERDVMLLSMVSAPEEFRRIRAMTDATAQRRFNVAASRARDQMLLFHTATLADLNPTCLRYQLLDYCLDPKVETTEVLGLDVSNLEHVAFQADRQYVRPPDPFDSWFELDVFLHIVRRGYRVIPQFEVGGYRIDLVVQGLDGNLAVECDGDAWHGPDEYETDAARQRDLERCGWRFWRLRESVFRLDPDAALSGLWDTLDQSGVFPTAGEKLRKKVRRVETRDELAANRVGQGDRTRTAIAEQVEISFPQLDEASLASTSRPRHVGMTPAGPDSSGAAPYAEWKPVGMIPDPRTADKDHLASLLAEIVECEGPVVAIRAYRMINRWSGSRRLTAPAKRKLNQACWAAIQQGLLIATNPLARRDRRITCCVDQTVLKSSSVTVVPGS